MDLSKRYFKKILGVTTFFLPLAFNACFGDIKVVRLDSTYSIVTTDVDADRSLSYDLGDGSFVGRVNGQVVAVGLDDNFIIAKQHLDGDSSKVNYYILNRKLDNRSADPKDCVIGPLDETQFAEKRAELGVPAELAFTKIF
jgi:hypothetical protein